MVGAEQYVDPFLIDEPERLLLRNGRVALVIGEDEFELGASQPG